jgi:hypothetical protein
MHGGRSQGLLLNISSYATCCNNGMALLLSSCAKSTLSPRDTANVHASVCALEPLET